VLSGHHLEESFEKPARAGGCFREVTLDAPVKWVAICDVPIPFSPVMERYVIPSVERIVEEA
jgi:pyruvate/2-oxoglutarate/acetoin dehydrogenase E1 component